VEWVNHNGNHQLGELCTVQKIRTERSPDTLNVLIFTSTLTPQETNTKYLPKQEKKKIKRAVRKDLNFQTLATTVIPEHELEARFEELRPPRGLPQGNVGTPLIEIKRQIQNCTLPTSALKKLVTSILLRYQYITGNQFEQCS
jgi:hypothetical protein